VLPALRGVLVVHQQLGHRSVRDPVPLCHGTHGAIEAGAEVA